MESPKKVSVHEEYLIYDLLAMISAVGGTLGLCIGFSFNDICSFILNSLEKGLERVSNNCTVANGSIEVREGKSQIEVSVQSMETKLNRVLESQAKFELSLSMLQSKFCELEVDASKTIGQDGK